MAGWTPEQIAVLAIKWATQTASDLAKELGRTRNAIIGKAHRLNLEIETRPVIKPVNDSTRRGRGWIGSKPPRPILKMKNPEPPTPVAAPKPLPSSVPVSLMDLMNHHCRAIVGKDDNNLATYCGRKKFDGFSYCGAHARLFYIKPKR